MENPSRLAGICGIFCGTCPMFPRQCQGCLSDKLAPHCKNCPTGFRACAKQHGVTWCYECQEFPCLRLEDFLDTHWENGISHHADVIENLRGMKSLGVAPWVEKELEKANCPHCGRITLWNEKHCPCK